MPRSDILAAPARALRTLVDRRDPLAATLVLVAGFFLLGLCRLAIQS